MFSFDNIGRKIKGWAKAIFALEAIAALIGGLALMSTDEDAVAIGLLIAILGPIVAWISSWLLYGYGQLIENSDIVAEEYRRKNEQHEMSVAKSNAKKEAQLREEAKENIANPNVSEGEYIDIICPNCKEGLSYTKEQLQSGESFCPMCSTRVFL